MSGINAEYRKAVRDWVASGFFFALDAAVKKLNAALPRVNLDQEKSWIASMEEVDAGFQEYLEEMCGDETSDGGDRCVYRDGPLLLLMSLLGQVDAVDVGASARREDVCLDRRAKVLGSLRGGAGRRVKVLLDIWEWRSKRLGVHEAGHLDIFKSRLRGHREPLMSWWWLLAGIMRGDGEIMESGFGFTLSPPGGR
jgi:hypothetical protein